ncbi:SDR family oxidoreductase [Streptomyces sp. NPDC002701]|uniref:SDR family oxidoreductase n=1 Tax=Streptomyces sp. NPDC002701 TaxID=3364661 RepID=UPI0036A19393
MESLRKNAPIKRIGTADDTVGTICSHTSEDAHFMTGQTLVTDGGWLRVWR